VIKKTLILLIALVTILAIVYFYQNNKNYTIPTENILQPMTEKTENANPEAVSALERGGSSFSDPDASFSILYPGEYKQDTQGENQYRIYKQGPTQTGQTEMYDGVIINFETIDLEGQALSKWVDERISLSTQDGTSSLIEAKKEIKVNDYPGYSYTMRGLGAFEILVIQKNMNSNFAVGITSLIADPGNLGFEQEFANILSTITLLK